jgi:tRNA threonylcarbamoyladenosine biosynthesis protein TsaE
LKTIQCDNIQQLQEVAKIIIDNSGESRIWVFKGRMGAGKTTLIKAIADQYQILDQVSSPTFSIVNEYQNTTGDIFYHFDFYRIEDPAEVIDIGVEEYFDSGRICWIEWAERLGGFIPREYLLIQVEEGTEGKRIISLNQIKNGA